MKSAVGSTPHSLPSTYIYLFHLHLLLPEIVIIIIIIIIIIAVITTIKTAISDTL
jgi:hypothetical protein